MEDSKRKKTNEWNNSDTCTLNWQQKHWTASLVKSMLLKRSLVGFEISYTLTCARAVDKHLGWSSCVYLCRGSLFKPSPCRYMCLRFTAAPMTILNWRSCVQLQLMQNAGKSGPKLSSPSHERKPLHSIANHSSINDAIYVPYPKTTNKTSTIETTIKPNILITKHQYANWSYHSLVCFNKQALLIHADSSQIS